MQKGGGKLKFKVIVACAIIICIPLAGAFLQFKIGQYCDTVLEYSLEGNEESFSQARDFWLSHQNILTSLITHEEVDNVTLALERACAAEGEELEESQREIAGLLEIVRNFDHPDIRSIF